MVSFILPGNSATGGYEVANSLRFDDGSSDNLTKTPVAEKQRPAKTIQAIAVWGESVFSSAI